MNKQKRVFRTERIWLRPSNPLKHQLGLEVELVWRQASDLLNYEIIEICTSQYIDMLVSTNGRLLTPPEEWLTYLMPQRTRLFFPPQELLESPKVLAQAIHTRAYTKQTRKQSNSTQLQHESSVYIFNNFSDPPKQKNLKSITPTERKGLGS